MNPEPSASNSYLRAHAALLIKSFRLFTGRDLVSSDLDEVGAARALFHAPFVVVSHDTAPDPIFTYGNRSALELFELSWPEFTTLASRKSAEAPNREDRERLLREVARRGFIDNYEGVRISSSARRFRIEGATVWNLVDDEGRYCGQAAAFAEWVYL
jgi:hypothetical protein